MIDPLAHALHAMRGSPNTEASATDHAEAATLRRILREIGLALVPLALDPAMRRAIWTAQAERMIQTPAARPLFVEARLDSVHQQDADRAAWRAIHAEAATRIAHG